MKWIGAAVITALMLLGLQRLVISPWQCNSEIKRLRNNTISALQKDPATQVTMSRMTLDEVEGLIHDCQPIAETYMIKAANERALNLNERAAETYRDALRVDRRPEIYANLGDVEMALGQQDEARRDYLTAARFNIFVLGTISDQNMRQEVLHQLALTGDDRFSKLRRQHRQQSP